MIVICETPVDLKWKDGAPAGVGVCETFDFEPLGAYQKRALVANRSGLAKFTRSNSACSSVSFASVT